MNCTSCGEENRENAKFCAECGTPVVRACANCAHPLSPTAKFCDECGTPVGASEPAAPATGAVRRTVTIMFADLVGSTAFGESVDAESARREMGAYHELTRSVIEAHGGELIKFIGDGVMAGFGVNDVAEDDADRAVRAGIDLQRQMVTIVDGIRDRHQAEVNLRVGINTGEVVIAEDDADMIGDAINTAARIEAHCTPGRVLVGEQTWRLTRGSVDYEVLGEVAVKGKAEPIATFQVLAAVEDEEVATPFVGRDAELAILTASLENTIADGAPQLVTVIGSPGVGKTRLAAEMARRASEVTSFDLRVDRAGAATFEPVADLLRTVAGLPPGLTPEETQRHLREFVGEIDDLDRLVPLLAGFVGAAPLRSTEESFWAARRLLEIVVAGQPAVIVIDDIQWAEPLFLDLLEHLVEWTEGAAFLVALARPEIRDIRPAFAEVGRRVSEVIALEGLDPATMAELATGILGGKSLPDELVGRLPESTEGNPLFVRELVRMLVDDGVITETPEGWTLAIDADAVEVPPTILSLLASRVERMDDDERRVIEAAAVVGSEFPRGAVGTLLPNLGAAQLDRLLERLRRQEVVDPTGTYWGDEPVWRFHHVLIRDAAYRRLLKERRIDMHRRVGQWTESTSAALGGEHEISIAFHYEQSHAYQRELGPLDADAVELGGRAADLLTIAADRALARDDLAAAGALASRALTILEADDDRRPALLLAACEAWFGAGRVHDGTPWLEELRAITGDERVEAWTAAFEGQRVVLTDPGRLHEIEPTVADAAERLAAIGDDSGVAKARLVRALILARTGRVGSCEEELDAALAAARAADDRRRITAVLGAAPLAALWGPSPVARAGGRCLDIIRLLRITSASPMVEAVSIRCQAVLEAMRGRFDEARVLIARSQEIVEELGLRHGILECRMFAGYIELLAGDDAAAEPHLRVAHAGLGTLGVGADAGQAAALLSRALLRQGRIEAAAALADASADLAGQNLQTSIASRAAQAGIAAHQGRIEEALALAEAAVAIGADTDLTMDHANARLTLAEVQGLAGDHRAGATSAQARELFEAKGAVVVIEADPRARTDFRSTPVETTATRHARSGATLLHEEKDIATWAATCRADAVFHDRRLRHDHGHDLDRERDLQQQIVPHVTTFDTRLIATRGDRLCLFASTVGFDDDRPEISTLTVLEVDDDGFLVGSVQFDPDDIQGAIGELTESYATGEAAPYADVVRMANAGHAGDVRFAGDGVTVDHRERNGEADVDGCPLVARTIERVDEQGLVATWQTYTDRGGALEDEWGVVVVELVRDGRVQRIEVFDGADLPKAIRRFEQLTGPTVADNFAMRLTRRFWSVLFDDLDADAAAELLNGGTQDSRARPVPDLQGERLVAFFRESLQGVTRADYELTPIAVRGDLHSAQRTWVRYEPSEIEREVYTVGHVRDGRFADVGIFDNADDAYAELERQYREHEGAEFADVLDAISAQCRALADLDMDRTWELAHPDCAIVDHRPLQQIDAKLTDTLAAHAAAGFHGAVVVEQFHRLTERGAVFTEADDFEDAHGTPVEFRTCQLRIMRDGKLARWEIYPEHEVEAACTRFDELTAAPTFTNRAFEVNEEFWHRVFDLRDMKAALSLLADDWRNSDERGLHLTDLDPKSAAEWFSHGNRPLAWSVTPVAIRGERVALSEMRIEWDRRDRHFLMVSEVDESGRATRDAQFEADGLRSALDLLNQWFVEGEGAPYRAAVELGTTLAQSGGWPARERRARLAEILHDQFRLVDHRRFGLPDIDRATLLEMDAQEEARTSISPAFLRLAPDALLTVTEERTENATGGAVVNRQLSVQAHRAGRVANLELFGEDQRAEAEARFEELAQADRRLRNLATDAAEGFYAELARGDLDRALAMLGSEWSLRDNRDLALADLDRTTAESWFGQAIAEGARRWTTETIAIRGRALAAMSVGSAGADAEWAYLLVTQADDEGRGHRAEIFDPDDLRTALDRLNEWYVEGEGARHRATIELGWALGKATELDSAAQPAALAELMHDDVQLEDHRPFSYPAVDLASLAAADVLDQVGVIVPEYLAIDDTGILIVQEEHRTNDAGGHVVNRHLTLMVRRTDKVSHFEWYGEDDLDTALARFDELTTAAMTRVSGGTGIHLPVEQTLTEVYAAAGRSDWDAVRASLAPDFEFTSADDLINPGSAPQNGAESFITAHNFSAGGHVATDILATRGRHLALTRFTNEVDGVLSEMYVLHQTDGEGRLARAMAFDHDLARARGELDRWWHQTLDAPTRETISAIAGSVLAAHTLDLDRVRSGIHEDFTGTDHREFTVVPPGFGRDFMVDLVDQLYRDGLEIRVDHAPVVNGRGGVFVSALQTPDGTAAWDEVSVRVFDDGLLRWMDTFSSDRLPEAIDRFRELTEGSPRGNRASDVDLVVRAAVSDRDMAAIARLVADDAVFVDHRPLAQPPVDSIENLVDSAHRDTAPSTPDAHRLVACYGEKIAFVDATSAGDAGADVHLFTVTEIDDDGCLCRFETFPERAFQAAQRCAIERWLDTEAPDARSAIEPLLELADAFGESDLETVGTLLAPDFRHTVAKPMTAEGPFDAAGFLENMRIWVEMSGSIKSVTREIVEWSDRGAVLLNDINATGPTGMVTEWASAHVLLVDHGKLSRWDEFEPHDLDTALARFAELTAPRNWASDRLREAYTALFEDRDLDTGLASLHQDVVVHDQRPLVGLTFGRDQFAENFREILEHDGDIDWAVDVLAVHGDHLATLRVTSARSGVDFPIAFLIVAEFDDQLCTEFVTFDVDDLEAASAEMERRSAETGPGYAR